MLHVQVETHLFQMTNKLEIELSSLLKNHTIYNIGEKKLKSKGISLQSIAQCHAWESHDSVPKVCRTQKNKGIQNLVHTLIGTLNQGFKYYSILQTAPLWDQDTTDTLF